MSKRWPSGSAYYGTCDVCEKRTQVVTWKDENAPTLCEPCYVDMAAAWDEMSPEEQAEVIAEIEGP